MKVLKAIATTIIVFCAGAAQTEGLADMQGAWSGSGWARETPQGPQEPIRCQLRNAYDTAQTTLSLSGKCVVPGRRLAISGTLIAMPGSEQIKGHWFNPNGLGSVSITGIQRGTSVAFAFTTTDRATGETQSQNVEWRMDKGRLILRSADRNTPTIMMSEIIFEK